MTGKPTRQRHHIRYNPRRRTVEAIYYPGPKRRVVLKLCTWTEARIIGSEKDEESGEHEPLYRSEADRKWSLLFQGERHEAAVQAWQAREIQRADREMAGTPLEEAVALYFAQAPATAWRADAERMLRKDVLPRLGKRGVKEIDLDDVQRVIDAIAERGKPIAARRTHAALRRVFNFAIRKRWARVNPCVMAELPGKERQRERVLSEAEILAFWSGLEGSEATVDVKAAQRLILVTGQRPGEARRIQLREISPDLAWWTIPAEKAKNGVTHRVPLNRFARAILEERIAALPAGENGKPDPAAYLFRGRRGPIASSTITNALRHDQRPRRDNHKRPLPPRIQVSAPFTTHDLRRTCASHLARLGVSRLVIKRLLNHVDRSVTAVYDRYAYEPELKQALDLWADELERILPRTVTEVWQDRVNPRQWLV